MNRSLTRTTAWMGLATPLLQFTGQGLIQAGGGEPPLGIGCRRRRLLRPPRPKPVRESWFVPVRHKCPRAAVVLRRPLRALQGGLAGANRWLVACGIVYAAGMSPGWEIAAFRAPEGLYPEQARFAFDLGERSLGECVGGAGWVFCVAMGITLLALPRPSLDGSYGRRSHQARCSQPPARRGPRRSGSAGTRCSGSGPSSSASASSGFGTFGRLSPADVMPRVQQRPASPFFIGAYSPAGRSARASPSRRL